MSKLVDAVAAIDTGVLRPVNVRVDPRLTVQEDVTKCMFTRAVEYVIGLKFEARCYVSEAMQVKERHDAVQACIRETKLSLIETVFGEFRPRFRRLHRALFECSPCAEVDEVRRQLQELERQMFEVGQ